MFPKISFGSTRGDVFFLTLFVHPLTVAASAEEEEENPCHIIPPFPLLFFY